MKAAKGEETGSGKGRLRDEVEKGQGGQQGQGRRRSDGGDEEEEEGLRGLVRKFWMGDEKPGWERRRLEREREDLASGKGYGDIIMEQVRGVFPGFGEGRKEDGEEKED